jgi:hypothetical protein
VLEEEEGWGGRCRETEEPLLCPPRLSGVWVARLQMLHTEGLRKTWPLAQQVTGLPLAAMDVLLALRAWGRVVLLYLGQ